MKIALCVLRMWAIKKLPHFLGHPIEIDKKMFPVADYDIRQGGYVFCIGLFRGLSICLSAALREKLWTSFHKIC